MTRVDILGAIVISAVTSFLATPFLMMPLAKWLDIMDHPSVKKVHSHPTPLLGGLAIFVAFFLALSLTVRADNELIGTLVGGAAVMVIGIIDDKFGMLPRVKLAGQFLASAMTVLMGVHVAFIKTPLLSMIFTCFWLVAVTNAFNLLDNINGLCAGVSAISGFFFGVLAFIHSDMMIAVVSFALMGSCLGFLPYNFLRKAKIFMGDAGSLFLGYILASIAVAGSWKTSSVTTSLAIPILILGYPIFDITLVTITRLIEGRPISRGGKDHSSHRLAIVIIESIRGTRKRERSVGKQDMLKDTLVDFMKGLRTKGNDRSMNRLAMLGFKNRRAVLLLYLMSFSLGSAALAMTVMGKYFDWTIMIISFILLFLFGIRLARVSILSPKR
ncbi:MAG: undecaprenyl/decaprenyl-phosphate alpha-N-acetylglucosaminyl 1-phosphate transferase [Candidatus Omnitrophica bacterium]|nr:undecaprenyl/decaprenyl-phosphate alpha-N-acetylglucosaminyl 1-phosphate transferase [Candidatus Omnitrophota bacterium]